MFRLVVLVGLMFSTGADAAARGDGQTVPADFTQGDSSVGIALYQKDYAGGNPDFVQVVDLSQGASLQLLHGPIVETDRDPEPGDWGGDNPWFLRQAISVVWDDFSNSNAGAFCLTNGQFFSTNDYPAQLAFPIKVNGILVSGGAGIEEFPDRYLMLELWADRADISKLSPQSLDESSAPNIIAGLEEDCCKGPTNPIGRTFVGVADRNSDGSYKTVLLFNSKTATQPGAAEILIEFGAEKVMMLDGGASTQLSCRNDDYITGSRLLPQTIATLAGDMQPYAAEIISQPIYPIVVTGERLEVQVELRNVGSATWPVGGYGLVNTSNPWGSVDVLAGFRDVQPGETANFSWIADPFSNWGLYDSAWHLEVAGQAPAGGVITITVVVVPEEFAEKKAELERQVAEWIISQSENVEQLILEWIQKQLTEGVSGFFEPICSGTGVLLPLGAALWVSSRRKSRRNPIQLH
ncbi:MAG: phosphodiester glycosidase family protein [Chloroflexi bacterium]|nr:phosphodiester glycosidase family protein [Chloroflexota bacterium]